MTSRNWKKSNSFLDCLKAGYEAYKQHHGDEEGGAADVLADVFHHTRDWTYAVLKGRTQFRAIDLPVWIRETGDYSALEWICEQVGVIPVRIPKAGNVANTAHTVTEFGEFLGEMGKALADGNITHDEAARIRTEGQQAIAAILANIEECEKAAKSSPRVTRLEASR